MIKLKIEVTQVPEVAKLFKPDLVVRKIKNGKVLEITEIFFDNINNLL